MVPLLSMMLMLLFAYRPTNPAWRSESQTANEAAQERSAADQQSTDVHASCWQQTHSALQLPELSTAIRKPESKLKRLVKAAVSRISLIVMMREQKATKEVRSSKLDKMCRLFMLPCAAAWHFMLQPSTCILVQTLSRSA